jgi:LCP family protein required for cell wall assembly
MPDGRHSASRGRPDSAEARRRALANEQRLLALGNAVDQRTGVSRHRRTHLERSHRGRRIAIISSIVVASLVVLVLGGGYLYARYQFDRIHRFHVNHISYPVPGQPFNILAIGSDSRVGLPPKLAQQTGAGSVAGQRSDVVKVIHVDPATRQLTILSIPRDTVVTLLANTNLYGRFNRINVNIGAGPSLLAQTITANFGIPINHVIEVGFGGLVNAAEAIGGVYLDFPHPARDVESGLYIPHPGCVNVNGANALGLARSRHYLYSPSNRPWPKNGVTLYRQGYLTTLANEGWYYDGSSDYGRIVRQNAFLRAMFSRVKASLGNPFAINHFLTNLPQGISIDSSFTFNEMIGLALKFHSFNQNTMQTYTLPTYPGSLGGADVLFVQEPATQQLLTQIFGAQLLRPTNPPPTPSGSTPMPPVYPVTTTTQAPHATGGGGKSTTTVPVTTTTMNPYPWNPVPCTPK